MLHEIFRYFFPKSTSPELDDSEFTSEFDISEFDDQTIPNVCEWNSIGESMCRTALKNIFGVEFITTRPDFLKDPSSNNNLKLDFFNKELNIAVEYNGRHHYEYIPQFHVNYKYFQNTKNRDCFKKKLCKKNNIILIIVPYTVFFDDIESFISRELEKEKIVTS